MHGGVYSVTANRYYFSGSGVAGEWEAYLGRMKKTQEFVDYEEREGELVC